MNKKINFFKVFVLSSFLLGGIEVVQASYDKLDDMENFIADMRHHGYQDRMRKCDTDAAVLKSQGRYDQVMHAYDSFFYDTYEGKDYNRGYFNNAIYMIENMMDHYAWNGGIYEYFNQFESADLESVVFALCNYCKKMGMEEKILYIDDFFYGFCKTTEDGREEYYSGMFSLITGTEFFDENGNDRTYEIGDGKSYVTENGNHDPEIDSRRVTLRRMLGFVIIHSIISGNFIKLLALMERDSEDGSETGKWASLLHYIRFAKGPIHPEVIKSTEFNTFMKEVGTKSHYSGISRITCSPIEYSNISHRDIDHKE